jgi:GNAT superfamily N-acetyltransferase
VDAGPVSLRRATPADADGVTQVWLRSFGTALPAVRQVHTPEQVHAWVRDVLVPTRETWVAVAEGTLVGMMVLDDSWLDQLYLDPAWRGRSIGDRFVDLAKRRRPDGLQLWTFQVNGPACRFYQRHGFVPVERTDGAGNEEREPDVRYQWRPVTVADPK